MSTQRTITVVATKGGRIEKIETDVATWGELKTLIQDNYDLSNLKAVENIGKTTLEHIDAKLPEGDFRLFLRPSKTKSGAEALDFKSMSFGEMKEYVKNNADAKKYLNEVAKLSDRNWTQLKTEERREALIEFSNINKVSQSTAQVEEVSITEGGQSPSQKISQAKNLIQQAVEEVDNTEVYDIASEVYEELDVILEIIDSNDSISEETEEERLEKEEIEKELREMEDGF